MEKAKIHMHMGMAFTAVMSPTMWSLGIAEKGTRGFTPTDIFLSTDADEANQLVDGLNDHFWPSRTLDATMKIVLETMRSI